jgi:hypothetical protein
MVTSFSLAVVGGRDGHEFFFGSRGRWDGHEFFFGSRGRAGWSRVFLWQSWAEGWSRVFLWQPWAGGILTTFSLAVVTCGSLPRATRPGPRLVTGPSLITHGALSLAALSFPRAFSLRAAGVTCLGGSVAPRGLEVLAPQHHRSHDGRRAEHQDQRAHPYGRKALRPHRRHNQRRQPNIDQRQRNSRSDNRRPAAQALDLALVTSLLRPSRCTFAKPMHVRQADARSSKRMHVRQAYARRG